MQSSNSNPVQAIVDGGTPLPLSVSKVGEVVRTFVDRTHIC